jgi:ribosome biogenesis GTPase
MMLEKLGWNDRFDTLFAPYRASNLIPARVIRVDRGVVTVQSEEGTATVSVAGRLDSYGEAGQPAVGDWVGMDLIGNLGVVHVILPRAGALVRRRPEEKDQKQVAAANVDLVLVVESLERGPNPQRIERASAMAWDGGATPVVVLTKLDLCLEPEAAVARAREGAPFVDLLMVSAKVGVGMEILAGRLGEGSTAVLLGPSGSGKSTLIDRLLVGERLAAADVPGADHQGHHTTTVRELFVLPSGGCLIDTPGVRELGLSLDPDAAMTAFAEIEEAARRCFYGEFRHERESGCAVQKEVDLGHLNASGVASYLRLRREEEDLEMRRDRSRRDEIRARERRNGKVDRDAMRDKKKR